MLTTIFYHIDEFCKWLKTFFVTKKSNRGRKKSMELSEIMTLYVYFHYSGYKTFKDFYIKHALVHLKTEFPNLVSYTRFVELIPGIGMPLAIFLKACCMAACTGISFIDSFPVAVCHNKRIYSHKVFKNLAKRGKTSMGWFYGFKVHLVINEFGEIVAFDITSGNISDNNQKLLAKLTQDLFGKLFGDKGYISNPKFLEKLLARGLQLFTRLRSNMQNKLISLLDKSLLNHRGIIESTGNILKNTFSLEHTRHRSPANFLTHLLAGLTAYVFKPEKPSITKKFACFNAN